LQFFVRQPPTSEKDIMGAQNFNFGRKLFQNGGFSAPNFVFLEENFFQHEETFQTS